MNDQLKIQTECTDALIDRIHHLNQKIQNLEAQNQALRQKQCIGYKESVQFYKAELDVLESQINPHFLYNTLDTIRWMAYDANNKEIESSIQALANILKISLSSGKSIIRLGYELNHVSSYLELLKYRYQDHLSWHFNIPPALMNCGIIKIVLQPIVENAVIHGIAPADTPGLIRIDGKLDGMDIILTIADNGKGIEPDRLEQINHELNQDIRNCKRLDRSHYGLLNVHDRIRLYFGFDYGLKIDSAVGQGTTVTLTLPFFKEEVIGHYAAYNSLV